MKSKFLSLIAMSLLVFGAPSSVVAQSGPMREPVGIYFRMDIKTNSDVQITNDVMSVLSNSAVAGILAVFAWSNLSFATADPAVGSNNFHLVDDVFGTVEEWNSTNTNNPKNIQLEFAPGFNTPLWVLSNLTSCDGLFLTNPLTGLIVDSNAQGGLYLVGINEDFTDTNCGCATFYESESAGKPHLAPLPLPWNPFYKNAWKEFIQAVAERYETNPILVSIAVDGPTSSTAEIILPNEKNDPTNYLKWNPLFAFQFPQNPSLTNTDTKFIKAWQDAIDVFGDAFSNLTLVITTGSGLPNFTNGQGAPYTNTYTIPPGFCPVCGDSDQAIIMDCAAEATILAYFADPLHGGSNAKAVQEDGLGAGGINHNPLGGGDLDAHGVKWLAQNTAGGYTPLPGTTNILSQILGGLQIGGAGTNSPIITSDPDTEGCPLKHRDCSGISPEQAIYNVLTTYFDGTPLGTNYGMPPDYGAPLTVSSNFPMNYLQIYYQDFLYANTNAAGSMVTNGDGQASLMTAQTLFSNASVQIGEIAELGLNIVPAGQMVQLSWLASAATNQLQVNHNLGKTDQWTNAPQNPVRANIFNQITLDPKANQSFYRLVTPLTQ